jgi:hypothetical protein
VPATVPPVTTPPVTTSWVQVNNNHSMALDINVNNERFRLEPGGFAHIVVEADPYGDGWGNDVIEAMIVGTDSCGYGDSDTWFEPYRRYIVTFAPIDQTCAGGAPGVGFDVRPGLATTG